MVALCEIVGLFTSLAQCLYPTVLLGSCGALSILFPQQDCSAGVGLVTNAKLIEGSTSP